MKKSFMASLFGVSVASFLVFGASLVWAIPLVTSDLVSVTTFQSGATVLGFDSLPPNGGGGSNGNTGTPIQSGSQLTDQFSNLGVLFSSTGGPVGVVGLQGLSNQSDARSPFNVIGGSLAGSPLPTLNYFESINVSFVIPNTTTPTLTTKVGAWNDPSGSRIRLSVFDLNGILLESTEADQGSFIGITNPSIASATFSFVSVQGVPGFSLDDVTFGGVGGGSPVPEPNTMLLLGSGLIVLIGYNYRRGKQAM